MKLASGILFLTASNQALFLKRGSGGDHAGEWCFPGGHVESGEARETCAIRETVEECGSIPDGVREEWTRQVSTPPSVPDLPPGVTVDPVDFTTFLQRVDAQFTPTLCDEHTGYAWADVAAPPEPLHPGARIALSRLSMNELGVARAIAAGELTSPQRYRNMTLWAIRITGTGASYRSGKDEYVWRKPENYLNDEFLARCAGLPVIWVHPEKATLDSKEFGQRIVGTIMVAWIRGDEVWGVSRIYDDEANRHMAANDLSTSPTVVVGNPNDPDMKLKAEDGKTILIEGNPVLLDHVAIVQAGVWDKGDGPSGVLNQAIGDSTMTEEEMADKARKDAEERENRAKADAEMKGGLDKLADAVGKMADGIGAMREDMSKRMDAIEAKADAACAKADAVSKKDEEEEEDKRKDGESEEAWKERMDKKRKDAEEEEAKAKKDAEEKEREEKEKADRAKADAADLSTVKKTVADLAERMKPRSAEDKRAFADAQARADSTYVMLGLQAPPPMDGEALPDYRRRLLVPLKVHSKNWKDVDVAAIADDAAFRPIENQVFADAESYARRPVSDSATGLRMVTRRGDGGHTINEFYGPASAWMNEFAGNRQRATGDWKKTQNGGAR